jgi:hypothetical protein
VALEELEPGYARARGPADVVRDRGRLVDAVPPGELRAQAPVDVLDVGEEALVERADVVERQAAVERRRGACRQHPWRAVVLSPVALALAAADAVAVPADEVAGAVEHVAPRPVHQL